LVTVTREKPDQVVLQGYRPPAEDEIQRKSCFSPSNGLDDPVKSRVISIACARNSLLGGSTEFQLNFFADQRIQTALSTEKQWSWCRP
jgi:hypothetical protein